MDKLKPFLAKPGLLRGLTTLYILVVFLLTITGHKDLAESLGFAKWIIPADVPIDPDIATAGLLAFAAKVRLVLRWLVDGFGAQKTV